MHYKFSLLNLLLAPLFLIVVFSNLNSANAAATPGAPANECSPRGGHQYYCNGNLGCEETCSTCFNNGFTYNCWSGAVCSAGAWGCGGGGGNEPPANSCSPGSSWCVGSNQYNTCIQASDGSWTGGQVRSCPSGQTCSGGSCVTVAPPPPPPDPCQSACGGASCASCGGGYCCGGAVCVNGGSGCCPSSSPYFYGGGCHATPYTPPAPPPPPSSCTQPYCTFGNRLTYCDGSYTTCANGCTGSAGSAQCVSGSSSPPPPPPPSGGSCRGIFCDSQPGWTCNETANGSSCSITCYRQVGSCGYTGGGSAPPPPPPPPSCSGPNQRICNGSCFTTTCQYGTSGCGSVGPICNPPPAPTCGAGQVPSCSGSGCVGVAGTCSGGWACNSEGNLYCSGGFTPPPPLGTYGGLVRIDSNNNGAMDVGDEVYSSPSSGSFAGVQLYPGGRCDGSQPFPVPCLPCSPDPAYINNCNDPSNLGFPGYNFVVNGSWGTDTFEWLKTAYFRPPTGYTSVTPNSVLVTTDSSTFRATSRANFLIRANTFNITSNVRTVTDLSTCTATSGSPYSGANLNLQGGSTNLTQATNGSGVTTFTAPPQAYTLSLQVPSGYGVVGRQIPTGGSASGTNGIQFTLSANTTATFCIAVTEPWFQTDVGDVRFSSLSIALPSGKYASTGSQGQYPGIYYSSDATANLGSGSVSQTGWLVNDEYGYNTDTQNRNGAVSYSFYKARAKTEGVTIHPLSAGILNPSEITESGVYEANGDLIINSYVHTNGNRVIILANGDITINTGIVIPVSQGILIMAAKEDVIISSNIGATTLSSTGTHLDGYYSAERSILIPTAASCPSTPDRRLNIGGALIANSVKPFAANGTGSIQNNRTLCNENLNYPTLYVASRLDFLTKLTDFYKVPYTKWKEERP